MSGPSFALVLVFVGASAASLATSSVLVRALERIAGKFGLREAALGLIAALAADGPEITASITALVHHGASVSAGVVFGSNAFNLAMLLGLAAILARRIPLDRSVVDLDGGVAIVVSALACSRSWRISSPRCCGHRAPAPSSCRTSSSRTSAGLEPPRRPDTASANSLRRDR